MTSQLFYIEQQESQLVHSLFPDLGLERCWESVVLDLLIPLGGLFVSDISG